MSGDSDAFGSVRSLRSNNESSSSRFRFQRKTSSKERSTSQKSRDHLKDLRRLSKFDGRRSSRSLATSVEFGGVLSGDVFVQGELNNQTVVTIPPMKRFHVYCSRFNQGATELMKELAETLETELWFGAADKTASTKSRLHVASKVQDLSACDHMLVYLTDRTWTQHDRVVELFAGEVMRAMDAGVHLLLAHEMQGIGQEYRSPCAFGDFFGCTPQELLLRGIYNSIASPLKGNSWRRVSMAILASEICKRADESTSAKTSRAGQLERGLQRLLVVCRSATKRGSESVQGSVAGHRLPFGLNKRASERGIAVGVTTVSNTEVSVDIGDTQQTQADAVKDEAEQTIAKRETEDILDDLAILQRTRMEASDRSTLGSARRGEEGRKNANADTLKRMRRAQAAGDSAGAKRLYSLIQPGAGGAKGATGEPDHAAPCGEAGDGPAPGGEAGVGSCHAGDEVGDGKSTETVDATGDELGV